MPDREPASGPLLAVAGLRKAFGGVTALAGVDLELRDGEMRCIIGPNGAGKSTFFKTLTGLVRHDDGTIEFGGRRIDRLQPFARARAGMSIKWQNQGVFQDLTVRQNLLIALRRTADGHVADVLGELLERAGLAGRERQPARELSHGEQQWLEIAMTLAAQPRLMLLDEPTAGMSRDETRKTAEMLRQINAEGITALVTEHDMEFVRQLETDVTVFHQGRVFAHGSLDDIEGDDEVRRIYLGSAAAR